MSTEVDINKMAEGIKISDITKVQRGIHTEKLFKATLVDPACSLSIITPARTLDLTFSTTDDRNNFFWAMHNMLRSYCPDQQCEFA